MAHRSGGGSHSGGHHGGGGHHSSSGRGGRNGLTYSSSPFYNSRKFRYYDRKGRERYIYCNGIPQKSSIVSLIISLLFLIPLIFVGIFTLIVPLFSSASPKPLNPVYESTDVHIMDGAGVIDNEDSLESVLQEFEDKTGISPYVMTVYDEDWKHFDELWDYAYYIYINTFSDEQHFLIVYSEPENAAELDFVDWSWEGIQGDDTDPILTESKVDRFGNYLQNNLYWNDISVGEAFRNTFENSLSYMMERDDNGDASSMLIFGVIWNIFLIIFAVSIIGSFITGNRDYQEVPMEGFSNTVPGAMGYGNNTVYQNGTTFQNSTAYQSGTGVSFQNNTTFQNGSNPQNGQMYQSSEVYQSNTNNMKKYMYYDKNGNKKYVSTLIEPSKEAFVIMLIVLIIIIVLLFKSIPFLWEMILMIQEGTSLGEEIPTFIAIVFGVSLVWNLALLIAAFFVVRRFLIHKNRDYVDVTGSSAIYNEEMTNNSASQYNAGMQYNGMQYNGGMPNNSASQYNVDTSQYNAASATDSDFYNDEARFRGPEYYDDEARYRGSTAYESGKK